MSREAFANQTKRQQRLTFARAGAENMGKRLADQSNSMKQEAILPTRFRATVLFCVALLPGLILAAPVLTPGQAKPGTKPTVPPGTPGKSAPFGPGTSGTPGQNQPGTPGSKAADPTTDPGKKEGEDPGKKEGENLPQPVSAQTSRCSVAYSAQDRLALNQPWEMHVDRSGASSYAQVQGRDWTPVKLPMRFGKNPKTKNHSGHVWFRCGIELHGEVAEQRGIYVGLIEDLDEVFFNGHKIGSTGSFNPVRVDIEKQRLYSAPKHLWRQGENLIVIHMYGTRSASGLADLPELVHEPTVARRLFHNDTPIVVLACIYMLVAMFFGLFAVFFWHRKENLYFALFSLSLGLYYLIRTRMRYELFNDFHFSYKMELMLLILAPVFFLNFLLNLIRIKATPVALAWQGYYALLLLTTLLAGKPTEWDMVVQANLAGLAAFIILLGWIFWHHYREHRKQLRYLVMGLLPVLPALVNDMMVAARFYEAPRFVVFAFLIFLTFVALQLADSVLDLYRNLQEQENELRQLEKRKTSSIFNISSEFRSIFEGLKSVIANFNTGKQPSGRKLQSEQKRLTQEVTRLNNFLTDSNLLPLLESGDYVARRVRFSVRKMCESVIEKVLVGTGEPSKRIVTDLPPDDFEMSGDPDLISAAMLHMLENALLYTKGQVDVSVERDGGELIVMVRDEGPGLDRDQQVLVFQKFVRGVDESSEISGTGVGLHIVQLVAQRLEGSFRLEPGGGFFSTFVLTIPLTSEQKVA